MSQYPKSPYPDGARPSYEQIANQLLGQLPQIVRIVGAGVRGFVDTDDLQQEVWIKFQRALAKFTPETGDIASDLRGLLTQIVRNSVIDWVRKVGRFMELLEEVVFGSARHDGMTPSRIVAEDEAFAKLHECVAKLDVVERDILWRRFMMEQKFAVIAHELGLTEDQIDHRYRNAIKSLSQMLGNSSEYRFDPIRT